jgi:2-keto-4-pentenoate hydratase
MENKVSMHPAVEIIGNRHQLDNATKAEKSLMTIADNGGGIGFVFGSAFHDWKNLNFRNHSICLQVDDNPAAENFLGDMRCQPLEAMANLVNHLSSRDISLRKGDFVSTGAATVPQPFIKGSCVNANFGIIGNIQLTFV